MRGFVLITLAILVFASTITGALFFNDYAFPQHQDRVDFPNGPVIVTTSRVMSTWEALWKILLEGLIVVLGMMLTMVLIIMAKDM